MDELLTELHTAEEDRRFAERQEQRGREMITAGVNSQAVTFHGQRTVAWAGRMARFARRDVRRLTAAIFSDPPGGSD